MFDNPGGSLKNVGGLIFVIGVILSIVGGMWMFVLAQQASQSYYCIVSFIFNKKILPTQASRDIIKAKVGEINGKTEKI